MTKEECIVSLPWNMICSRNLSSSGLTGTVNSSFGDLKSLQQL